MHSIDGKGGNTFFVAGFIDTPATDDLSCVAAFSNAEDFITRYDGHTVCVADEATAAGSTVSHVYFAHGGREDI